jgi:hypothetical protein
LREAVIENGRIVYISHKLPKKRLHVHLVNDEDIPGDAKQTMAAVRKTAGVYKTIDPLQVANGLRKEGDRRP